MAQLHSIPQLIDLALGTPEIGAVNFNILNALLHTMSSKIFNIDKQKIEIVQNSEGKLVLELPKYDDDDDKDDEKEIVYKNLKSEKDFKQSANEKNISKNNKNSEKNKSLVVCEEKEYITMLDPKPPNVIDLIPDQNTKNINDINFWNINIILKIQRKQSEAVVEAQRKLNEALIEFQKSQKPLSLKELTGASQFKNNKIISQINKEQNNALIELQKQQFNILAEIQKKQHTAMLEIFNKISVDTTNLLCDNNFSLSLEEFDDEVQNSHIYNNAIENVISTEIVRNVNNEKIFDNKIERQRAGYDDGDTSVETFDEFLGEEDILSDDTIDKSKLNEIYSKFASVLTKLNVVEFEQSRLKDSVNEIKRTDIIDHEKIHEKIDKFELFVQGELKRAHETTIVKNDHLKMLIGEYEHVREESINFKKDVKTLISEIRRDVQIQKELGEKIVFPTPLVKSQFEYFQEKFEIIENNYAAVKSSIENNQEQIRSILDRLEDIDINIFNINSALNINSNTQKVNLMELIKEFNELKILIESIKNDNEKISDAQIKINCLFEETNKKIDLLNTSKLDRCDVDELLAEKADYNMLQNKVSVDSFETNRRTIEKFIKDTTKKLIDREAIINTKFRELSDNINGKLDQNDLATIRETVEKKMELITSKITTVKGQTLEPEAAGSRRSLLRNVNCLSCDQYVVMKTQELNNYLPKIKKCHASKTIGPEIVYKLDKIATSRKENINPSNSRNMHHFELISKAHDKWIKDDNMKQALRHCGGSHTKVTNRDRLDSGIGHSSRSKDKTPNAVCVKIDNPEQNDEKQN